MKTLLATVLSTIVAVSLLAGEYPDITIKDLRTAIDAKKVAIIDANGTKTWEKGHIPGAIDFATSKEKLAKLLPADKEALVVAYCGGPSCKAYQAAAKVASDLGYKNVKHLSAGISGWTEAGEKIEKPGEKKEALN